MGQPLPVLRPQHQREVQHSGGTRPAGPQTECARSKRKQTRPNAPAPKSSAVSRRRRAAGRTLSTLSPSGRPSFGRKQRNRGFLYGNAEKILADAFRIKPKDVTSLVVQLVIFVVVCAVVGALIALLAKIPVLGILFGIVGGLLELYALIGIVLSVLVYFDMLK